MPFQRAAEKEVTPSQPAIKEEEEIVEIFEFEENFEVFSYLQSSKVLVEGFSYSPSTQVSQIQEDIGIQHKPRASLMEVIESQVGGKVPEGLLKLNSPPFPLFITLSKSSQIRRGNKSRRGRM